MSGNAPPADWDNVPPPDGSDGGAPARVGGGAQVQRGGYQRREAMPAAQVAQLAAEFHQWLDSKDTLAALKQALPDHIDLDVFVATAKQAVMTKPDLLKEELRPSLLRSVARAAAVGLLPDGKQGALVARYDTDAGGYAIAFQPMVGGIIKLGRETGAIKSIRAHLVFRGEHFRIVAGDEDKIEHIPDPDIIDEAYAVLNKGLDNRGNAQSDADGFMLRVYAAYCVITGSDGTVTKRFMTRQRIISLRQASRASRGPWNSRWLDEMILKGVILFTSKWINLDVASAPARRFMDALTADQDASFVALPAPEEPAAGPALLAPPDKLAGLEMTLAPKAEREPVPVAEPEAPTSQASAAPHGTPPPDEALPPDLPADQAAALRERVKAAVTGFETASWEAVQRTTGSERYRFMVRDLTANGMFGEIKRLGDAVADAKQREPV